MRAGSDYLSHREQMIYHAPTSCYMYIIDADSSAAVVCLTADICFSVEGRVW